MAFFFEQQQELPFDEPAMRGVGAALRMVAEEVARETGGSILFDRFSDFHLANPQVYDLIERFALELINAGHAHFGIGAVYERVRWEVAVTTRSVDGLKLNNNHRAYYARLFRARYPEHARFFATRQLGRVPQMV